MMCISNVSTLFFDNISWSFAQVKRERQSCERKTKLRERNKVCNQRDKMCLSWRPTRMTRDCLLRLHSSITRSVNRQYCVCRWSKDYNQSRDKSFRGCYSSIFESSHSLFLPKGAVNDESSLFLTLPLNMSSLSVEGDDNDDPCGTTVYVLVYLLNSRFTLWLMWHSCWFL